jgi:acyl-CoA synthetase (AMP-forming)/AMP-acid ligase II
MSDSPTTISRPARLIEVLKRRAAAHPLRKVFTFFDEKLNELSSLTYGELESRTKVMAAGLLARKDANGGYLLTPGARVVLVFVPSLDFIVALIACLRAQLVAVPAYPPDPRNLRVNVALFAAICASAGAKVALSHKAFTSAVRLAEVAATVGSLFAGQGRTVATWPGLTWIGIEELPSSNPSAPIDAVFDGATYSDIAFLQYTSGSTSEPKGVIITHEALAHNLSTIVRSLKADKDTIVASWLPQYHDMGLVGSYLGVIYCGGTGVYMSPLSFMKSPLSWLELVTRYKATHVQAPNFAFALTARRFREAATRPGGQPKLRLDSLIHVFNAAEPVTDTAMSDFTTTFRSSGFNPISWSPGYGLAESTVYVCDGGSFVCYVDREALETTARARVLAVLPLSELGTPAETVASEKAHVATKAASGGRIAALVSCGPVSCPAGLGPMVSASSSSRLLSGSVSPGVVTPATTGTSSSTLTNPPPVPSPLALRSPLWAVGGVSGNTIGIQSKNPDVWVLVVNPDTSTPLPAEGGVGEIWIHSESLAAGYYGKEEATRAAFKAHLAVPPGSTDANAAAAATAIRADWLRTGDLGFIWHGELFICGRSKDLIIMRGRNFFPQDIEAAAEADAGRALRPGCSAAFVGADEMLVFVAEVREAGMSQDALATLSSQIRAALTRDFGLNVSALLLLKPGGTRKTTSGKVARAWNKRAWDARVANKPVADSVWHANSSIVLYAWGGDMNHNDDTNTTNMATAASSSSRSRLNAAELAAHLTVEGSALMEALKRDIADMLCESNIDTISPEKALLDIGLDSLSLAGFAPRLRAEYGLKIEDAQVFDDGCSLGWIVNNARGLRRGPVLLDPIVGGGRQRKQPTYIEANCPCFLLCYGS